MRFKITWSNCEYRVSIPRYKGGEVVTADEHDALLTRHNALIEALRGLLGSLDNGEFKTTITHSIAAEMAEKVYRINRAEVDRLIGEVLCAD